MKTSFTIAAIILALGMSFVWRDHQRLLAARALHENSTKEAGLSSDGGSYFPALTRRERRKPDVRAKFVAAEFLAYHRAEERQTAGEQVSADPNEIYAKAIEHVRALNPEELKALIQELRDTLEIDGSIRWHFVFNIISNLFDVRPESALELHFATVDLAPPNRRINEDLISKSIQNWAKDDPDSALKWLKENERKLPANAKDKAKEALLSGVASRDPAAAFRMLSGLGMDNPNDQGIDRILSVSKTPELRMAAIAGIREYVATLPDEKKREGIQNEAVSWLGYDAAEEGFESGSKWIASANFTEGELNRFVLNLGNNMFNVHEDDAAKWVQWVNDNLPAGEVDKSIRNMVSTWARADYQAAADWIRTMPDGPLKNNSTRAYAEAVSEYEPDFAVEWAATLPAGKERDATFKKSIRTG
jgi:DNA-directed RNA polymerase subunit F